jgi:hypoxanthine phosphoribosyltransferase
METIIIHDNTFQIYLESKKIQAAVEKIATQMNRDLNGKDVIFLVILNGSFLFAADLLRRLTINCRVSFLKLSSYEGFNNEGLKQLIGINEILEDKTVVIIEDIIDTGSTLDLVINQIRERKPAELKVATLLLKPDAYEYAHKIEYVGFRINNQFVVGYGLDYDGFGRNLNSIYSLAEK